VIEVDGVMIFGTPKSHQCRSVPVARSLTHALAAAGVGKAPTDLVFTAPRGGVLMLRNWRRRVFDPAIQAAGLGELTPHELRHTAASLAVAAGTNVKAVQRMLGHASAARRLLGPLRRRPRCRRRQPGRRGPDRASRSCALFAD
jgi:integrase